MEKEIRVKIRKAEKEGKTFIRDKKGRFTKKYGQFDDLKDRILLTKKCAICGSDFECTEKNAKRRLTCGNKECQKEHANIRAKKYKKPRNPRVAVSNPSNFGKCPLLEKCGRFGIDCSQRDYTTCDFYRHLLMEKQWEKTRNERNIQEIIF